MNDKFCHLRSYASLLSLSPKPHIYNAYAFALTVVAGVNRSKFLSNLTHTLKWSHLEEFNSLWRRSKAPPRLCRKCARVSSIPLSFRKDATTAERLRLPRSIYEFFFSYFLYMRSIVDARSSISLMKVSHLFLHLSFVCVDICVCVVVLFSQSGANEAG